jgi:hypothetical protein
MLLVTPCPTDPIFTTKYQEFTLQFMFLKCILSFTAGTAIALLGVFLYSELKKAKPKAKAVHSLYKKN